MGWPWAAGGLWRAGSLHGRCRGSLSLPEGLVALAMLSRRLRIDRAPGLLLVMLGPMGRSRHWRRGQAHSRGCLLKGLPLCCVMSLLSLR